MTKKPEPDKAFFDAIRPLFGGRLTLAQVEGLILIVTYGLTNGYSRPDLAYVLATAFHETGRRMQPIREGFARSNAGAIRAVTGLYNKGIISRNYALQDGYGNSYYGRGYVQITWKENYAKFENILGIPLVANPDLALLPEHALDILFIGMRDGLFRNASLADVPDFMTTPAFTAENRDIINGDVRKNGPRIAGYAAAFFTALDTTYGSIIGHCE